MNEILEGAKFVSRNSRHVGINEGKLKEFCRAFRQEQAKNWLEESPFRISSLDEKEKLHFLLLESSMSFCFWGEPKWTVEYRGRKYDGSWGMIASLGRAIEDGIHVLDPGFLESIKESDLEKIFAGNVSIPLLQERVIILREIGEVLSSFYGNSFVSMVNKAGGDALQLLDLVVSSFSSFNDFSFYRDRKILFYKRAQLLVGDISAVFKNKGIGKLENIGQLTACADYKLPQILRKLGIFSYSLELAKKIDCQAPIPRDSIEEIEIRANTVWAVELMKKELKHSTAQEITHYLWLMGQQKSPGDKPYHRTRTIFY